MTDTLHLELPFIEGSQAQKHVTHNEALRILDAVIQIAVQDRTRTAPPPSPAQGQRHVVASGPTGAWAGNAHAIATWRDGAWAFLAPKAGWRLWSVADASIYVFDGAAWQPLAPPSNNVGLLGVNTTASAPNLLSVKSNSALLAAIPAADGGSGDARLQITKETAGGTASVFFSDTYSGRAEFGLTGDDDFHLKVSADGVSWQDAFIIDTVTAEVAFHGFSDPAATRAGLGLVKQSSAFDATADRVMMTGAFGWGDNGASTADLDAAVAPGAYASDPSTAGRPPGDTYHNVLVQRSGSTLVSQIAVAGSVAANNVCWVRGSNDGGATWSGWSRLYLTSNVVGAVTQSGGAPTGAIIERGSNANGEYTKFADGTMYVCGAKDVSVGAWAGAPKYALAGNVTLPATFAEPPVGVVTSMDSSVAARSAILVAWQQTTSTITNLYVTSAAATPNTSNLRIQFFLGGRWF